MISRQPTLVAAGLAFLLLICSAEMCSAATAGVQLLSHYTFDAGGANLYDDTAITGASVDSGTVQAGTPTQATGGDAQIGAGALECHGGEGISLGGGADFTSPTCWSASVWLQHDDLGSGDWGWRTAVGDYGSAEPAYAVHIGIDTGSRVFGDHGGGATPSTVVASAGTWYHIVSVRTPDGQENAFYVNGVKAAAISTGAPDAVDPVLYLCTKDRVQTNPWNGKIDDFAWMEGALTASQVASIYTAGQAGNNILTTPTGCTDPGACNYDPSAVFDDESCITVCGDPHFHSLDESSAVYTPTGRSGRVYNIITAKELQVNAMWQAYTDHPRHPEGNWNTAFGVQCGTRDQLEISVVVDKAQGFRRVLLNGEPLVNTINEGEVDATAVSFGDGCTVNFVERNVVVATPAYKLTIVPQEGYDGAHPILDLGVKVLDVDVAARAHGVLGQTVRGPLDVDLSGYARADQREAMCARYIEGYHELGEAALDVGYAPADNSLFGTDFRYNLFEG